MKYDEVNMIMDEIMDHITNDSSMPWDIRQCPTCPAKYNYNTVQSCPICSNYIPPRIKTPEMIERDRRLNRLSRERIKKRKLEEASKGWKSYVGDI